MTIHGPTAFGPVKIIPGKHKSRFPFSNSIFIDDDVKAIVDTGAGSEALEALKKSSHIDLVINSHYHFDHIAYNYLFDDAKILLNDIEAECYRDRHRIGILLGMTEVYGDAWVDDWLTRISNPATEQSPYSPQNNHKWWLSTARIDAEYKWGDIFDFGKTRMHVIGAPGHSEGFCCMYFPDLGIVYVADIDLTVFGPWYGGTDGNIDLFIDSCRKIEQLDAKYFVTGHEFGVVTRDDFRAGLAAFLDSINQRDSLLLAQLTRPMTLAALSDLGIIYGKKFHVDAWVYMWNYLMTKKHLERLITRGRVVQTDEGYVAV